MTATYAPDPEVREGLTPDLDAEGSSVEEGEGEDSDEDSGGGECGSEG